MLAFFASEFWWWAELGGDKTYPLYLRSSTVRAMARALKCTAERMNMLAMAMVLVRGSCDRTNGHGHTNSHGNGSGIAAHSFNVYTQGLVMLRSSNCTRSSTAKLVGPGGGELPLRRKPWRSQCCHRRLSGSPRLVPQTEPHRSGAVRAR